MNRPEPPLAAGETETLVGFLEYHRATFAWKCAGLDAAGLAATVGASTMTLGGMLKHLAYYEDHWFSRRMQGNKRHPQWAGLNPEEVWTVRETPEALHGIWHSAVDRSRTQLAETLANGGLDQPARRPFPDGEVASVRWIVVHMIEEYARHNGHADLIRESVDGSVGE
ncbi:DinB family protein [Kribbella albertanoniae]|uniref:DinB family protein n=1 Tax=Kribbella albertanoniae TaxID=1266829 RepID=A0A4R4NZG4_9ACTN|nr:DinB family protein [Kribbella albertanoniae]TDC15311.1 DinB family protein [Kribbella albertanoniae]